MRPRTLRHHWRSNTDIHWHFVDKMAFSKHCRSAPLFFCFKLTSHRGTLGWPVPIGLCDERVQRRWGVKTWWGWGGRGSDGNAKHSLRWSGRENKLVFFSHTPLTGGAMIGWGLGGGWGHCEPQHNRCEAPGRRRGLTLSPDWAAYVVLVPRSCWHLCD